MMNFTLKGSKKFHNLVNDNDYGCRNKLKENLKGDKRERERERLKTQGRRKEGKHVMGSWKRFKRIGLENQRKMKHENPFNKYP